MPQQVIHVGVGVGVFGKRWCTEFLKTNVVDGTIEVVAVVFSAIESQRRGAPVKVQECINASGSAIAPS